MKFDTDAVRRRHLRPEQWQHRTFYEGHIMVDLQNALDHIDALRQQTLQQPSQLPSSPSPERERSCCCTSENSTEKS